MEKQETPPGRAGLDAIRAQLRELGYLRGPLSGLEGWVLAGGGGPSSLLKMNAASSLRVALVGGPLLGLPAAAAVVAANRPHFGSPRDLILLALYLSAVLGAAVGILEFLTDFTLAWLGRRGLVLVGSVERLAGRVGLLFFAATTLYLAFLIRSGRAALGGSPGGHGGGAAAWLLWAAALIIALAVGHLVGRLARVASLASLAAVEGAGGLLRAARSASPRRRPLLAAGLLGLAAVAGLLAFLPGRPGGSGAGAPSPFVRAPSRGRVLLVGIDGLDAALFDRMAERGACPALTRLASEGARYEMAPEAPRVPPAAWTTIATGRPARDHGILGYQADRVPGLTAPLQDVAPAAEPPVLRLSLRLLLPPLASSRRPVSSGLRRARAVWEILQDEGVAAAVVNWWATWPAAPTHRGVVVSERAFVRLASGSLPDRDAAPEPLQRELASRFQADLSEVRAKLAALGLAGAGEPISTPAVVDGYHALVARRLVTSGLAESLFLYLPGLDIARARPGGAPAEEELALLLRHLDALVEELRRLAGPEDLLLVVGDPGRTEGPGGLLLAWGSRVSAGRRPRQVSRADIAPTVLALSGFPVARDLPGAPVLDFLRVGDVACRPVDPIETYGSRPEPLPGPAADPFDQEVLDRLRSLGYIQ